MRNEPCQTANVPLWREFCEATGRDPAVWSPHWTELDVWIWVRLGNKPPRPTLPGPPRYDYEAATLNEIADEVFDFDGNIIEVIYRDGFAIIDKTRGHDKPMGYTFDRDAAERIVTALNRSET